MLRSEALPEEEPPPGQDCASRQRPPRAAQAVKPALQAHTPPLQICTAGDTALHLCQLLLPTQEVHIVSSAEELCREPLKLDSAFWQPIIMPALFHAPLQLLMLLHLIMAVVQVMIVEALYFETHTSFCGNMLSQQRHVHAEKQLYLTKSIA